MRLTKLAILLALVVCVALSSSCDDTNAWQISVTVELENEGGNTTKQKLLQFEQVGVAPKKSKPIVITKSVAEAKPKRAKPKQRNAKKTTKPIQAPNKRVKVEPAIAQPKKPVLLPGHEYQHMQICNYKEKCIKYETKCARKFEYRTCVEFFDGKCIDFAAVSGCALQEKRCVRYGRVKLCTRRAMSKQTCLESETCTKFSEVCKKTDELAVRCDKWEGTKCVSIGKESRCIEFEKKCVTKTKKSECDDDVAKGSKFIESTDPRLMAKIGDKSQFTCTNTYTCAHSQSNCLERLHYHTCEEWKDGQCVSFKYHEQCANEEQTCYMHKIDKTTCRRIAADETCPDEQECTEKKVVCKETEQLLERCADFDIESKLCNDLKMVPLCIASEEQCVKKGPFAYSKKHPKVCL